MTYRKGSKQGDDLGPLGIANQSSHMKTVLDHDFVGFGLRNL